MGNLSQDDLLNKIAPGLKPVVGIIENIVPIALVIGGIFVVSTMLNSKDKTDKGNDDGDGIEGLIRKARKVGVKV